ncbi:NADPH-dependent F420 reductase [Phaeovulum sp.]|uniref:NADPH-dependent F420 reductase n=1 Tax=Phaeovulum sp. TaxID=2934796 RepID=UPI0027312360|nr:NAD(P)-binding domain-containing protein [Phaeovulum sp.]MDP1668507.1 NAD(P)-binding domain-containing protein [Phaeovulum sp.]MDZ4118790.1 NAD(P)-binding domain-containing protein [Phaeovulum sp.]
MKIAMIGGGMVGQTLAAKLLSVGHEVTIGIRAATEAELAKPRNYAATLNDWQAATGGRVTGFAAAAADADLVFNVTSGLVSLAALTAAGAANLAGKVLIDVSNPLDFSAGMPPFLPAALSERTSVGEEIQKAFPEAQVVKAFNTISAPVMVEPGLVPGVELLIAGNSAEAKAKVTTLARQAFGWQGVLDLGDISGARGTEHLMPIWLRLYMTGGSPLVALKVIRG